MSMFCFIKYRHTVFQNVCTNIKPESSASTFLPTYGIVKKKNLVLYPPPRPFKPFSGCVQCPMGGFNLHFPKTTAAKLKLLSYDH